MSMIEGKGTTTVDQFAIKSGTSGLVTKNDAQNRVNYEMEAALQICVGAAEAEAHKAANQNIEMNKKKSPKVGSEERSVKLA